QPFHSGHACGHGLGLYVCKEIVSRHQGTLTVQSRLGEGTHFTISLPAHRPSQCPQH
ncbi:MAG TPA: ATP-binding protein, partial [bacterium]|nr:ATP-binding protein [bacterium]